jgi:hypothetical protein
MASAKAMLDDFPELRKKSQNALKKQKTNEKYLMLFALLLKRNPNAVCPLFILCLQQRHYLAATLEKVQAFFRSLVHLFPNVNKLVYQMGLQHELKIRVELHKTQVRTVHNPSFQSATLRDFQNLSDYAEFISPFGGFFCCKRVHFCFPLSEMFSITELSTKVF